MSQSKSFYITTTLPYVNAEPHIGHALEMVQADVIARYQEFFNKREIFFNTGTDEHGTKVFRKAQENNKDIHKYVDENAEKFKELKKLLNLHPALHFIRTTEKRHIEAAQEMWNRAMLNNDIDKRKYRGLYCVADEVFVKETDLVNGRCSNHPTLELEEIEEENYFFKFGKYKNRLKDYLRDNRTYPGWRCDEAIKVVDEMDDFSISREKSRLPWGIPVPGDDNQVMYVWFDALTSYISTLGWPEKGDFEKFWVEGETLQLAGKDQVKFQSVIWQAMLMSAGIKNTDKIFYHGFINSGGHKMSKSLGNVIGPNELVKKYGTEATRYLLIKHVNPFEDTDITWDRLDEWYNAHLVNGIGNLTSRIMKMAEEHLEPVEVTQNFSLAAGLGDNDWGYLLEIFHLDQALDQIAVISAGKLDEFIQNTEPFKEIKINPEKAKQDLKHAVQWLWSIANLLSPFMPETSSKILQAIRENKKPENLFPRLNA